MYFLLFSGVYNAEYADIAGLSSARVGVETSYFRAKCVNISKTVVDTAKVTINH